MTLIKVEQFSHFCHDQISKYGQNDNHIPNLNQWACSLGLGMENSDCYHAFGQCGQSRHDIGRFGSQIGYCFGGGSKTSWQIINQQQSMSKAVYLVISLAIQHITLLIKLSFLYFTIPAFYKTTVIIAMVQGTPSPSHCHICTVSAHFVANKIYKKKKN